MRTARNRPRRRGGDAPDRPRRWSGDPRADMWVLLVVGEALPRLAALGVALGLTLGAQRRVRHQLQPRVRDLLLALLAQAHHLGVGLEPAQRPRDLRQDLRLLLV